jgi:hypothetical protein
MVDKLPTGKQWQYEPKWDGFRCLFQRDGNDIMMTSNSGQDLSRYFAEVGFFLMENWSFQSRNNSPSTHCSSAFTRRRVGSSGFRKKRQRCTSHSIF